MRLCPAAGGPDADYSAFEGHDLHVIPSAATLTFEHSYTWWGNRRKLRVAAQPNVTLSAAHVPARCRRARTVLLGPLTPADVDCVSFMQQPGTRPDRSLAGLDSQHPRCMQRQPLTTARCRCSHSTGKRASS